MKTSIKAAFLVGLLALGACGKKDNAEKKVLAKVGSLTIVESDVTKELENAPPAYRNYLSTMEGKKQFIEVLIKEKVLLNAAEKAGVTKKEDIQAQLKEFEERMKKQQEDYRKNLILRDYLQTLQEKDLKVSDQDIETFYTQNKAEFDSPLLVGVSHILCPTESEAAEALARVNKGENFAKVAQEVSKDPSAARGGAIGSFRRGDLSDLPEFEAALFALKTGEVSNPVKTKLGYHIVRRDKDSRLAAQSLKEAAPYIRRSLEKKKFDAWIEKEKNSQNVSIDEKALSSLDLGPQVEIPAQGQAAPASGAQTQK